MLAASAQAVPRQDVVFGSLGYSLAARAVGAGVGSLHRRGPRPPAPWV